MTLADEPRTHTAARPAPARHPLPWWGLGLANLGVILLLSLVTWWVVVDSQWSVFGLYPQPFTALLFWMLMGTVWVGFTFEWLGPASLRQPWRGLVGIALTIAIGVGITLLLAYGWGVVDPSFAADREGGAGFATGNLFVLFGFFFYVLSASCHGHWPWSTTTRQPWTGFGQLTLVLVPTLVAYLVFVLPNPGLVLAGHPLDERRDGRVEGWATGAVRVGPLLRDQEAVPP
jgi:AAT family amino acid transporter